MNEQIGEKTLNKNKALFELAPDLGSSELIIFSNLEDDTQNNILEYAKDQKKMGMKKEDALASLKTLIRASYNFDSKGSANSDKTHEPKGDSYLQDLEREEAEEFASGSGDRIIEEVEKRK